MTDPAPPPPPPPPRSTGELVQDPRYAQVRRVADLLDTRFRIPGTQQTFGVDAILGIVPGIGDAAGLAAAAVVIGQAVRLGARGWTLVSMFVNAALDATVGSVPVAGTVFDVVYKANTRNVRLLEEHVADATAASRQARRSIGRSLAVLVIATAVLAAVLVVGLVWLLRALF